MLFCWQQAALIIHFFVRIVGSDISVDMLPASLAVFIDVVERVFPRHQSLYLR